MSWNSQPFEAYQNQLLQCYAQQSQLAGYQQSQIAYQQSQLQNYAGAVYGALFGSFGTLGGAGISGIGSYGALRGQNSHTSTAAESDVRRDSRSSERPFKLTLKTSPLFAPPKFMGLYWRFDSPFAPLKKWLLRWAWGITRART